MNPILPLVIVGGLGLFLYEKGKGKGTGKTGVRPTISGSDPASLPPPEGIPLTVPYSLLDQPTSEAAGDLAEYTRTGEAVIWLTPHAQEDTITLDAAIRVADRIGDPALQAKLRGLKAPGPPIQIVLPFRAMDPNTLTDAGFVAGAWPDPARESTFTVWLTPEAQLEPMAITTAIILATRVGERAMIDRLQAMLAALTHSPPPPSGSPPKPGADQPAQPDQPDGIFLDHLPDGQTILFPPAVQEELHRMSETDAKAFVWYVQRARSANTLRAARDTWALNGYPEASRYLELLTQELERQGQTGEWGTQIPADEQAALDWANRQLGLLP